MLDIHTHILPAVDDGSKSVQMSVSMLRRETKQGIDEVVLTPHFYAHRESPERFLKRRAKAAAALEEGIDDRGKLPRLHLGAEVAYFGGMSQTEDIEVFCIGDTGAMLVEMPFCKWNRRILEEIYYLRDYLGIQPILAHIERYMRYQPLGTVRELCDSGILIQANAGFFTGWPASVTAMHMLKNRCIHFIGSDCHDLENRPPNMAQALANIEKKLGEDTLMYLNHMERMLLEGELK